MYPIHIPTFTDNDLEWMNSQTKFYVQVDRMVMYKLGIKEHKQIIAKYCLDKKGNRILYPIIPDKERGWHDEEKPVDIDDFIKSATLCGFQQIGATSLDLGGLCESSDDTIKIKKTILFIIDEIISYGDMTIIGYCKQFDCNIGLTVEGKWMEDDRIYILPKSVTDPSWKSIELGQFVGSRCHDKVFCEAITKFPYKIIDYVYEKFE